MNMIQRLATTKLVAPSIPTSDLQGVLAALQRLHDQARQAQWISAGPPFRAVHLEIDEIYDAVREHADSISERILPIVDVIHEVLDEADARDPAADILHAVLEGLEDAALVARDTTAQGWRPTVNRRSQSALARGHLRRA
jgi:Ferritin-like domain